MSLNVLKFKQPSSWLVAVFLAGTCPFVHAACAVDDPTGNEDVRSLPLISIGDLNYAGGFSLPADTFGSSSMNFSLPIIEKSGNSLFVVGHVYDDAIAEFSVPALVNSTNISNLNSAGPPLQNFSGVLNRATGGNTQSLDQINGLELYNGRLIVNAMEYYDGSADNTSTTLVVSNSNNISSSTVNGYFRLPAAAQAAGWMSELPAAWKDVLGKTHVVGNSSGDPIEARHSLGPSAYAVDAQDVVDASLGSPNIPTDEMLEYSLSNPLHNDTSNNSGTNDLWTKTAKAAFGFVVPGSRTYATFGMISGIESGIGYKITQDNGNLCGGYCPHQASDIYNYYWFFDMNDLLDVRAGMKASHEVRPYSYGKFNVPFQTTGDINPIAGGSFDLSNNTLYFSINYANNTLGNYDNPPVIAAYTIDGL